MKPNTAVLEKKSLAGIEIHNHTLCRLRDLRMGCLYLISPLRTQSSLWKRSWKECLWCRYTAFQFWGVFFWEIQRVHLLVGMVLNLFHLCSLEFFPFVFSIFRCISFLFILLLFLRNCLSSNERQKGDWSGWEGM